MRILVGTLYTIENEFAACCAAIQRQTHTDFEHLVLEKLPNKVAHDTLYRTFMQRSDEFDLLIKIDADMVIRSPNLFAAIVAKFRADPLLDEYVIQLHDFFTDRPMWGMSVYRNTVRWQD